MLLRWVSESSVVSNYRPLSQIQSAQLVHSDGIQCVAWQGRDTDVHAASEPDHVFLGVVDHDVTTI